MLNHGEVKEKYNELQSYTDTARLFGVTRQRIHQIVTNYRSTGWLVQGRKGIWEKKGSLAYLIRKIRAKPCDKCGGITELIHHNDGNSRNNKPKNLIPLCYKCHGLIHRGKGYKSKYDGKPCLFCKKPLLKKRIKNGQFCTWIHRDHYNNPTRKFNILKGMDFKCADCDKTKYHAKNRCTYCYYKYFWRTKLDKEKIRKTK